MTVTQLQTADTATMGDMLPVSVDWEQLFREQRRRLHHFIRKRVSNLQDVEDLEQMTWLEVLRNRDKFAGASRPETWVFGIALNLVRNHFRTQSHRLNCDELEADIISDIDEDPCNITEHHRLLSRTLNVITALPEETRHLLSMLVELEDSYQAIACHLNVPIGTVRSRLSRVRQVLKSTVYS